MADAKSSVSLSMRLSDIAARLDSCRRVALFLAVPGCEDDKDRSSMLFLLEAQLGRLGEELDEEASALECMIIDSMQESAA